MRLLRNLLILTIWTLTALISKTALAAPLEFTTNPCPSGFKFADFNEQGNWNVCIKSSLFDYNNVGEDENSSLSCPLVDSGSLLQAWNPEAGVCFTLANAPGGEQIFGVTRNANKAQILVDLFPSKEAAGCIPGSDEAYLLSPAEVYCLKDTQTEGYESVNIEGEAEDYFQRLLACDKSHERELSEITAEYKSYLEFAYYTNPNTRINFDMGFSAIKTSDRHSLKNSINDMTIGKKCDPNVSRMIGITN